MSKGSGVTRVNIPTGNVISSTSASASISADIKDRTTKLTEKEKQDLKADSKYESIRFYSGGGFLAIATSPKKHSEDEITVGRYLAKSGLQVILLDESGQIKTRDGLIITMGNYEQRTTTKTEEEKLGIKQVDKVKRVRNAISHAHSKQADIALIYLKEGGIKTKDVRAGIKAFVRGYTDNEGVYHRGSNYQFKTIITVSRNGRIRFYDQNELVKKKTK